MTIGPNASLQEEASPAKSEIPADRILSADYRQGMRTVLLMDTFEHSLDGMQPTYDLLKLRGVFWLADGWRGLVIARKPYFMPWCGEGLTLSGLLRIVGGKEFSTSADLPPQIAPLIACDTPVLLRAQNSRNREGHGRRFGQTSPYLLVGLTKE